MNLTLIITIEIMIVISLFSFGVIYLNSDNSTSSSTSSNTQIAPSQSKASSSSNALPSTRTSAATTSTTLTAKSTKKEAKQTSSFTPDYDSLMSNLPKNQMIQDLPEGKSLYLKVFRFSSGNRVWEKSFIVGKGTMKEGNLNSPEVTLTINSKYVNSISSSNLCEIMGQARKNGDLGFESSLGYASLLIKYSSLMKYKGCFS